MIEEEEASASKEETKNTLSREQDCDFECNICLDRVEEPVVTLCGHLYCWGCLYRWLNTQNICPVCKAGVTQDNVIPVYSRGSEGKDPRRNSSTSTTIPSRPSGQRPEPELRRRNVAEAFGGQQFTFAPSFGFFPSLFGLQFQSVNDAVPDESPQARTTRELQQQMLSRILLILGSLVLLGLLLF